MEKFKYIKNIADGEATMLLYDQIGDSVDSNGSLVYGISGSRFAYEMQYLQSQDSVKCINVRINSIGGSVLDGYSIVSAILNSPCRVNTYIDGLAASIAGVIAVSGKKCCMMDYGTLMVHNPSGGEDKKVLALIKDTLVTILSNRTAKTQEEICAMMDSETWMNAQEALSNGMVDEIISTEKKVKTSKSMSLQAMVEVYNKVINPNNQMKNINAKLKLAEGATELDALNAIDALEKKNTDLANELKVLKDAALEKERIEKEARLAKATALANKAVEDKKIKEDEKENVISNASASDAAYELISNMINKISVVKEAVKIFNAAEFTNSKGAKEDRSSWTIRDWEKKDPKGLQEIYDNARAIYDQMYNEYYKKNK